MGRCRPAGSKPRRTTRLGTSQPVRPHTSRLRALPTHEPRGTAYTGLSQGATVLPGTGRRAPGPAGPPIWAARAWPGMIAEVIQNWLFGELAIGGRWGAVAG